PNLLPFLGLYYSHDRLALVSPWMENGHVRAFLKKERYNTDRSRLERCTNCPLSIPKLNRTVAGFPPDLPLIMSSTLEPVLHPWTIVTDMPTDSSFSPSKWEGFVSSVNTKRPDKAPVNSDTNI
ncbi:hypothetical protein B0H13DRAFT_1641271, partial [Mycena leptocephala]